MSNPTLPNPTPITTASCATFWSSSLTLSTPLLSATLRPCDGQHVLGNRSLAKRVVADTTKDAAAAAVVAAVAAQMQRLSGKAPVSLVTVSECDPLAPVSVLALFADKTQYKIPDLFALVGSDPLVAAAYAQVIAYLATK
jgi:hypothetical protein